MPSDQHPEIIWTNGVPIATRFDDSYFSLNGGLEESRHVFLEGNGLRSRLRPGFRIAELGFGTGLNCLATWSLWQECGCTGNLSYVAFERFPMAADDMARALTAFPEIADQASALAGELANGAKKIVLPGIDLEIIGGDARETLPGWPGLADAWFLDGFSPAKNPELWEPELLREVARHTEIGGTVATYSAAGAVRRGLAAAGFDVERRPGFGSKRHMTVARRI
ncbi:MAG: tRNA (5-methylaminomethyl-2-thiouridine)(34)-methyltransferase MnmD [Boseongicola sp.]